MLLHRPLIQLAILLLLSVLVGCHGTMTVLGITGPSGDDDAADDDDAANDDDAADDDDDDSQGDLTYTISLRDSFGDGWEGNRLIVFDGSRNKLTELTLDSGGSASFEVETPDCISTVFDASDAWWDECSYEVKDPSGATIFSSGLSPDGPGDFTDCEAPPGDDDDDDDLPDCVDATIRCGQTLKDTTEGAGDDINDYACFGGGEDGPDRFYSFTAPYSGFFDATMAPGQGDLDLILLAGDTCDPSGCVDASIRGGDFTEEDLRFSATEGETLVLVVDGWQGDAADFVLTLECSPPGTGGDADGDLWPADQDCDDSDPSRYPGAPEACNGLDEDCDGAIDEDVSCGPCYSGSNGGKSYLFCLETESFWSAVGACDKEGYYLVTVNDEHENSYLAEQVEASVGGSWWIGTTDSGPGNEGDWSWIGEATSYTNWLPGEPNNSGGNEDCGEIAEWANYQWNDSICSADQRYICERDF